jgi:hypothetical protein
MTFFDIYNKVWFNVCNKSNASLRIPLTKMAQDIGFGELLDNSETFNSIENSVAILDIYVKDKLKDYEFNL